MTRLCRELLLRRGGRASGASWTWRTQFAQTAAGDHSSVAGHCNARSRLGRPCCDHHHPGHWSLEYYREERPREAPRMHRAHLCLADRSHLHALPHLVTLLVRAPHRVSLAVSLYRSHGTPVARHGLKQRYLPPGCCHAGMGTTLARARHIPPLASKGVMLGKAACFSSGPPP